MPTRMPQSNPLYATTVNERNADLVVSSENTNGHIILKPKTSIIDVRRDFAWTISPKSNTLQEIPAMYLTERTQKANSLISSALYYITTILDKSGVGSTLSNSNILTSIIKVLAGAGSLVTTTSFQKTLSDLKDKLKKLIDNTEDVALLDKDTLKSYIGIYLTTATGFKYVLPYFSDSMFNVGTSWAETAQNVNFYASGAVNTMMASVDSAASSLNILQPGTFIEKPKYFQYPAEGESITVTFPLLNTHKLHSDILPYQQNYELLWILAYQNKPYRTSFSRIIPPKIYTLCIPGIKYMPYCYISSMTIDFQGTRRNLSVTLPTGKTIQAPIPDAYVVTITFTSLLADIANMMVTEDFGSLIRTGTK